jgi:hypothetical protein
MLQRHNASKEDLKQKQNIHTHHICQALLSNTCASTDVPENLLRRRPELWYWEAARQLQLLAAVALVVFTPLLPLSARAALLLLLFAAITFNHAVLVPFKDAWVNTLEFSVLATTLFNISGALLISGGAAGGNGSWRSLLLGLVVLSINAALVTCIVYSAFRNQLKQVRDALSDKRTALMLFWRKLIQRCRLGRKCFASSSPRAQGAH